MRKAKKGRGEESVIVTLREPPPSSLVVFYHPMPLLS